MSSFDIGLGGPAGGIPMNAPIAIAAPPRSAMRRLITPWEYRHLSAVAGVRFVAGGFTLGIGTVLLSLGRSAETGRERRKCYGWAAFFLVLSTLQFLGGYLNTNVARSEGQAGAAGPGTACRASDRRQGS
jgi:hypothetical protein